MDRTEVYKEVFNSAPDAIIVVNDKGAITMTNDQVKQLFGYSREELAGKSVEDLIPDRYKKTHGSQRHSYNKKPITRQMGAGKELIARRKDGSEFFVEISLSPLQIHEEKLVMAAIRDVSNKVQMNQRLQESLAIIEKKNEELERFAFIASHDLQEPLNTIKSLVELFAKQYAGELDAHANEYIHLIAQTAGRMGELIKDLLEYSRLGQGLRLEEVDCNEIVGSVIKDISAVIKSTNAIIEVGQLPVIVSYATELRLLFQNLISNGIKFRRAGTKPKITITAVSDEDHWQFSVADNGIGIEKGNEQKIFQIFTRLHSRSEYEGTGIGLAQCLKIIDTLGGRIWVESVVGEGSTFYFTIPKTNHKGK